MSEDALLRLVETAEFGALATLRRDGRPQLSTVKYAFDQVERTIRISVTDDRAKTKNLRRDPRASFYVTSDDGWSYAVVDSTATLTPVAVDPGDATVDDLVDLYRSIAGEHPDWDAYREAMVADRRLVVRLPVERVYGSVRAV